MCESNFKQPPLAPGKKLAVTTRNENWPCGAAAARNFVSSGLLSMLPIVVYPSCWDSRRVRDLPLPSHSLILLPFFWPPSSLHHSPSCWSHCVFALSLPTPASSLNLYSIPPPLFYSPSPFTSPYSREQSGFGRVGNYHRMEGSETRIKAGR